MLEWRREEGWGVLASSAVPDEVWAHFSAIQAEGFRELTAGQPVTFTVEQAQQDQFHWRAVSIWPGSGPLFAPGSEGGLGYSSGLDITFDS
ncbi:cold shock domain-containing protein [Streptomyces inhibens]|uniref:Cold shock domain-containing protein n=1 Tax=Streptomyces inhibens TaxID=2293571 RepID=A0A371PQ61_STRIH|nr:cold shock domain-containing protein [Streptomyces inhibens]